MNKRIKRKKLYKQIEKFMDKFKIVESCCRVTTIYGQKYFNIEINGVAFSFDNLKIAEEKILKLATN